MSKVYIIDDDRNIVESLKIVLESDGHDVTAQHNEENVVNNVLESKTDLIILDVMFPENESAGFEIARVLKKNEKTCKIPIIMLSAINEKGIYAGGFSNKDMDQEWLPVSDFVEKPVKPEVLLQKVKMQLANK